MKNPTPKQISIGVALLVSLFVLIGMLILKWAFLPVIKWYYALLFPAVVYGVSYFILIYALEMFIYRKIKLVYKSIANTKTTKEMAENKMDMNRNIIKDVEEEAVKTLKEDQHTIQQLRKMEEYRRQFLGDVSHELKTPIFHIQGYLDTLIEGGINDTSVNMKYLEKANKNAERLSTIVDDLEMISLIEDGKLNLEIEAFNLWALTNEVFELLAPTAQSNNISLKFKKGFFNPCYVKGDRERIRQILVNLVSNAIKYGKPGGKVTLGDYDMDTKILVEVCDNGIGIDKQHLPRIFERFYRVDKSRSREKGGTGLGLSIVKHILEAHGQSINVRSNPGEGTTFSFTLDKA